MNDMRRRLVVMVKEPRAGQVKTRLAHDVGVVAATAFYRHSMAAVLGRIASACEWETLLAVAPDAAVVSRTFPQSLMRVAQGRGDLGARMQRVMDDLPPGPVVIIGSDIPGIVPAHIRVAFQVLGQHEAVFGPAPDGGYWLAGLKRFPRIPRAFKNVRWSGPHALADTLRNLEGLSVAKLGVLIDVDGADDLADLKGWQGRRVLLSNS